MISVDVVVPVYNEERALPQSIPVLRDFLSGPSFRFEWRIVIADNASVDNTPAAGQQLAASNSGKVEYVRIERKGRGFALKQTWLASPMDIVSYMDVDLSTGLEAFPALVGAIANDGYDVAVGSRLARKSQIIVPLIEDNNWFFDTELLILAEKMGYRVKDVPVKWVEDMDTRVKIAATVTEDMRGLLRLRTSQPWRRADGKSKID